MTEAAVQIETTHEIERKTPEERLASLVTSANQLALIVSRNQPKNVGTVPPSKTAHSQ